MGAVSDYLENKILDHVFKVAALAQPTSIEIALSTADPLDDGSGLSEPLATAGYARVTHNTWNAAAGGQITNSGVIQFPQATGSWGTITHFAIFDNLGNMLFYGPLSVSMAVETDDIFKFNDGAISISLDTGAFSDYLENKILDHVFKNTAYGQPTSIDVGLSTADPLDDGSGLAEPLSTAGYSRVTHNTWNASAAGTTSNSGSIQFPTATGDWGTITHVAVFDDLGNLLVHGALTTAKAVTTNVTFQFASGALQVSLD